jgi:type IV fimbrial biogenesis protein FimT
MERGKEDSRLQRGVTLIEALMVFAVASILIGSAAPSFLEAKKNIVLDGTASEVRNDIQYARTLAAARNEGVRISFPAAGDGSSCMVIHTGATADCICSAGGVPQCAAGVEVFRAHSYATDAAVVVYANVASMYIDPVRGTFSPTGTVRIAQSSQGEIHHVVNIMGRTRSCSPNGRVNGYKPC